MTLFTLPDDGSNLPGGSDPPGAGGTTRDTLRTDSVGGRQSSVRCPKGPCSQRGEVNSDEADDEQGKEDTSNHDSEDEPRGDDKDGRGDQDDDPGAGGMDSNPGSSGDNDRSSGGDKIPSSGGGNPGSGGDDEPSAGGGTYSDDLVPPSVTFLGHFNPDILYPGGDNPMIHPALRRNAGSRVGHADLGRESLMEPARNDIKIRPHPSHGSEPSLQDLWKRIVTESLFTRVTELLSLIQELNPLDQIKIAAIILLKIASLDKNTPGNTAEAPGLSPTEGAVENQTEPRVPSGSSM